MCLQSTAFLFHIVAWFWKDALVAPALPARSVRCPAAPERRLKRAANARGRPGRFLDCLQAAGSIRGCMIFVWASKWGTERCRWHPESLLARRGERVAVYNVQRPEMRGLQLARGYVARLHGGVLFAMVGDVGVMGWQGMFLLLWPKVWSLLWIFSELRSVGFHVTPGQPWGSDVSFPLCSSLWWRRSRKDRWVRVMPPLLMQVGRLYWNQEWEGAWQALVVLLLAFISSFMLNVKQFAQIRIGNDCHGPKEDL